jgi:eukaryotic-like serine/threonine-protein kinase
VVHRRRVSEPGKAHIGPDRLEVAADRGALAAILAARGRHREAQQTLRYVLSVLENVLGADHYEVAATLDRLAASVQHTGDLAQAALLHERSLVIKRRILGPDHVEVTATASRLAACRASAHARRIRRTR